MENSIPLKLLEGDENYLIARDFLSSQLPKYADIVPIRVSSTKAPPSVSFKFSFALADGSLW
mgnify:CR=1 FL=1